MSCRMINSLDVQETLLRLEVMLCRLSVLRRRSKSVTESASVKNRAQTLPIGDNHFSGPPTEVRQAPAFEIGRRSDVPGDRNWCTNLSGAPTTRDGE